MRSIALAGYVLAAGLGAAWSAPAAAQYTTPTPSVGTPKFTITQGVSDPALATGIIVDFTVRVGNAGTIVADPGVVTIRQSPELGVPDGMAAAADRGVYHPEDGRWEIGLLQPGSEAVLVLPAQVTRDPLGPCIFSLAELWPTGPGEHAFSVKAFATLRAPGVESCVDLVAGPPGDPGRGVFSCDDQVTLRVPVANHGPDTARDVTVVVQQDPARLPRLVFTDSRCEAPGQATCRLALLSPGTLNWVPALELRSAPYRNRGPEQMSLTVSVSSGDQELEPGDETSSRLLTINPPASCPEFEVGLAVPGGVACFVATAAWGSPLHPHVNSLRRFRDRLLLPHAPGRAVVGLYYRLSPPLARYIAARPVARAVARGVLWPLVFAVERPWLFLLLVAGLGIGARRVCRRAQERR